MIKYVIKRDGRRAKFNPTKISNAITSAFLDKEIQLSKKELDNLTDKVCDKLEAMVTPEKPTVGVEAVQDVVEDVLMSKEKYKEVAKAYILYRDARTRKRESSSQIINTIREIKAADLKSSNILRDNANESGCTPAGAYGKIASETNKTYNLLNVVDRNIAELHSKGYMHIHDLNLYDLTFNCLFAPIGKLLEKGFDSGTGFIRSPKSIQSAASITAVILQLQSNQQFGGIASANLDFELAPYVDMSFKKNLAWILASEKVLNERSCAYESFDDIDKDDVEKAIKKEAHSIRSQMAKDGLSLDQPFKDVVAKYDRKAVVQAYIKTKDDTYQAMEGLVHNLNSLQSRSGNQVPFSSLNFGLDTSRCGRLVSSNLIAAQMAGLGDGLTAIFPILIIKYMKGVTYLPDDPNYDLRKAAIACLARRFYPNGVGVDNPFNAPYIRYEYNDDFKLTNDTLVKKIGGDRVAKYGDVSTENDIYPRWEVRVDGKYWQICQGRLQRLIPESTVSTMGCRTRVIGNVNGPQQTVGRGNIAFHTLNLPKLAVEARIEATNEADRIKLFNEKLDRMLVLARQSLEDRFNVIAKKTYENFPFTMQQGLYLTSDDKPHQLTDTIAEVLRQGTLSIGYIGVYEAVLALTDKTWGKDEDVFDLGYGMIKRIRDFCDKTQKETHMNWSCFATPAEAVCGRFCNIDMRQFMKNSALEGDIFTKDSVDVEGLEEITVRNIATENKITVPYSELLENKGKYINTYEYFHNGKWAVIDSVGKQKLGIKYWTDFGYHMWGKGYFTNSHMLPFGMKTTLANKIKWEAPFHEITNAGHIFYHKMDGDLSKNLEGVEQAMNAMYEGGMGYFTVTMDSDTCIAPKPDGTFCGFHGVINGKCPKCGNTLDKYILRVRRITGYLTGSPRKRLEWNWNPGKLKELGDRVSI